MHPTLSEFPRRKFYRGLLKDGVSAVDRQHIKISSNPIVFWDTNDHCPEEVAQPRYWGDTDHTFCNCGEALLVEDALHYLIKEMGVEKGNIGVITPYKGQRNMISEVVASNRELNPEGKNVTVETNEDKFYESKSIAIHSVSDIMIASIDAFQGREKDFIIISCVRSNDQNQIGFLKDTRRLNVANTRARFCLILIGDLYCLKHGDVLWKEYVEFLEAQGSVLKGNQFTFNNGCLG